MRASLRSKVKRFNNYSIIALLLAFTAVVPFLARPQAAHAASPPSYRYTKAFDATGGSSSAAFGVATDKTGNVYVVGQWQGTVTFDGVGGSDTRVSPNPNVFLTKYSNDGTYDWTKTFDPSAGDAFGFGVATDPSGNVYMTGQWDGTVNFDGVGGSDSQTDSGGFDTFLTKINANGSYGYTKVFDVTNGDSNGSGVATDANGNVYINGYWHNTVIFDGPGGSDTRTNANDDTFVTKYTSNGTYVYTKVFDTTGAGGNANGYGLAIDSSGNIYATGYWGGTVVFDGVGGSDTVTSPSTGSNVYLTKYNADGSYAYTKFFDLNSPSGVDPSGIAVDSLGNVYESGFWSGTVTFDGVGGSDSLTTTNESSYLIKYKSDGTYVYVKTIDSTNAVGAYGESVATDINNNVYLASYWTGTVLFDGPGGHDSETSSPGPSIGITQFDSSGNYQWTKVIDSSGGSVDNSGPNLVATDDLGNIYTAADFSGTVVFDGPGGSDSRTNSGGDDSFLTSYHAFDPPAVAPPPTPAKAPNTGYGAYTAGSVSVLAAISGLSIVTATAGLVLRKKAWQK